MTAPRHCPLVALLGLSLWLVSLLGCGDEESHPVTPEPERSDLYRVPSAYPTIQAAIDAAGYRDTVLVAPGIYRGEGNRDLVIQGKDIILMSEAGAESTIIECEGTLDDPHRGMSIVKTTVRAQVIGFTIRGGMQDRGGGIHIENAGAFLNRCFFEGNQASRGGAVSMRSSNPRISLCEITNNTAEVGGGIFAEQTYLELDNTALRGNVTTESGGALTITGLSTARIEYGVDVTLNRSVDGAISILSGSAVSLIRCLIVNNQGQSAGAIRVADGCSMEASGCTVTANRGEDGALSVDAGAVVTWSHGILRDNCGGPTPDLTTRGKVTIYCSAIDTTAISGSTYLQLSRDMVLADPEFCDVAPCGPEASAEYDLPLSSPCIADNSPCGTQIGARGWCGPGGQSAFEMRMEESVGVR